MHTTSIAEISKKNLNQIKLYSVLVVMHITAQKKPWSCQDNERSSFFNRFNTYPTVLIANITNIVNLSLTSCQFHGPSYSQGNCYLPLLKKPTLDKDQLANYHPICLSYPTLTVL